MFLQLEKKSHLGELVTQSGFSLQRAFVQWSCKHLAGGVKHWACCLNVCYNLCAFVWEGKEALLHQMCYHLETLHSNLTRSKQILSQLWPSMGQPPPAWRGKSSHGSEVVFPVFTENCSKNLGETGWYEKCNSVCPESACDLYSAGSWNGDRCQDLTSHCATGVGKCLNF